MQFKREGTVDTSYHYMDTSVSPVSFKSFLTVCFHLFLSHFFRSLNGSTLISCLCFSFFPLLPLHLPHSNHLLSSISFSPVFINSKLQHWFWHVTFPLFPIPSSALAHWTLTLTYDMWKLWLMKPCAPPFLFLCAFLPSRFPSFPHFCSAAFNSTTYHWHACHVISFLITSFHVHLHSSYINSSPVFFCSLHFLLLLSIFFLCSLYFLSTYIPSLKCPISRADDGLLLGTFVKKGRIMSISLSTSKKVGFIITNFTDTKGKNETFEIQLN